MYLNRYEHACRCLKTPEEDVIPPEAEVTGGTSDLTWGLLQEQYVLFTAKSPV